jgi:hypothetical protein
MFSKTIWTVLALLLAPSTSLVAQNQTLDGYVTKVISPTEFEIGKYKISENPSTVCGEWSTIPLIIDFVPRWNHDRDQSKEWQPIARTSQSYTKARGDSVSVKCTLLPIRLGSHVSVIASLLQSDVADAKSVGLYRVNRSPIAPGLAILEDDPQPVASGGHLEKTFINIDGYTVALTNDTQFCEGPPRSIIDVRPTFRKFNVPNLDVQDNEKTLPIKCGLQLRPALKAGTWVSYSAVNPNGDELRATKIIFWQVIMDKAEHVYRSTHAGTLIRSTTSGPSGGRVLLSDGHSLDLSLDEAAQSRVAAIGVKLIPEYYLRMPKEDSTRIDFRFAVIKDTVAPLGNKFIVVNGEFPSGFNNRPQVFNTAQPGRQLDDLVAMPDGLVLVPEAVTQRTSDSQLAALISFAVTAIIEKQSYQAYQLGYFRKFKPLPPGIVPGTFAPADALKMEQDEQLIRIGLARLRTAGYEITDAPLAWAVSRGERAYNPVVNPPRTHPDWAYVPWYAAYGFDFINHYYSDADEAK